MPACDLDAGSVEPMFIAPDDAKTDVILVGAVFVFGRAVQRIIVTNVPGYPTAGFAGRLLAVLWILALTAFVPVLLARHRRDRLAAFGLDGPRASLSVGLLLALPVIGAGLLRIAVPGGPADIMVVGRLARALLPAGGPDPALFIVVVAELAALSIGTLLAVSFLAVRAREGFPRSPELPLTQLIRTVGLIAIATAGVLGLLNALRLRAPASVLEVLIDVAAIAVLLALVDRRVPRDLVVPRSTVIGPVVVVLLHPCSGARKLLLSL
jgi:hypothetical protein